MSFPACVSHTKFLHDLLVSHLATRLLLLSVSPLSGAVRLWSGDRVNHRPCVHLKQHRTIQGYRHRDIFTLVGDWLMVTQAKHRYDIIKWPKSDQLIFRQVFIEMDQDKKRGNLFS